MSLIISRWDASSLTFKSHVYGLDRNVRNNIAHVDDDTVIYPAGTNLVINNCQTQTQRFIHVKDGTGITAMAVSQPFGLVAVAVTTDKSPMVVIYDLITLKKRKSISLAECPGVKAISIDTGSFKEYISICFTPDAKNIIAQSSGPDWFFYMWNWDKGKLMGSIKATNNVNADVRQIGINKFDTANVIVSVIGNSLFRIYKYQDGQFRIIVQQKPDHDLLCHAWLSESRIAAGTNAGKLIIYEHGDMIMEILFVPQITFAPSTDPIAFQYVIGFANDILVGTSTGAILLYEKTDDDQMYRYSKQVCSEDSAVSCISVNRSEDSAVCTFQNSQIHGINLDVDEDIPLSTRDQTLFPVFHWSQIVGLDTCARKPIIATCGADRSVRIWNYADKVVEVSKYFNDDPYSIALHPSGLYVLVGFSDCLALMSILIDDIRQFWTANIKGCRECSFSNGGQYFAAVFGSTIVVHSTWTFQQVFNLKGHQGKVKSIHWTSDDKNLLSCGLDGIICNWSMKSGRKEWDNIDKKILYSSITCSPDSKLIMALTSDGIIREFNSEGHLVREMSFNTQLTQAQISRSGRYFIGCSAQGVLRALKFPFIPETQTFNSDRSYQNAVTNALDQSLELQCHSSAITRMRLSYDESLLFTVSDDGCLWVYKIHEKGADRLIKKIKDLSFSDETLVEKSHLIATFKTMSTLKKKVEELKKENDNILRQKDADNIVKMDEASEKYRHEVDGLSKVCLKQFMQLVASMKDEIRYSEPTQVQNLNVLKRMNAAEIAGILNNFNAKIESESEKYLDLDQNNKMLQSQWEQQVVDIEEFHSQKVNEITLFYKKKLDSSNDDAINEKNQIKKQSRDYQLNLHDIEDDVNQEILNLQYSFEIKLKDEKHGLSSIKEDNISMKSRLEKLSRGMDDRRGDLGKMSLEERKLNGIIKALNNDILVVRKEMQERDDTITDKEKRIYDLKKKNQELEKFKFVLDYKIVELKKQVEPRELDIIKLSTKINAMDGELLGYYHESDSLDTRMKTLLLKLRAAQSDIQSERSRKQQLKELLACIKDDVSSLSKLQESPQELKIHRKYEQVSAHPKAEIAKPKIKINGVGRTPISTEPRQPGEIRIDTGRERDHFEQTIRTLKRNLKASFENGYVENLKTMHENMLLLSEVNTLRRDLKNSELRTVSLKSVLKKNTGIGINNLIDDVPALEEKVKPPYTNHLLDKSMPTTLPRLG